MSLLYIYGISSAHAVFASSPSTVYPRLKLGIRVADTPETNVPSTLLAPSTSVSCSDSGMVMDKSTTTSSINPPIFSTSVVYSPAPNIDWKVHVSTDGIAGALVQQQIGGNVGIEMSILGNLTAVAERGRKGVVGVGITIN